MKPTQRLGEILNKAVKIIGPECNGKLEFAVYEFLRRYAPMICADVVLIPEGKEPSVLLAKRDNSAGAPWEWWIFGGRVYKKMDYRKTIQEKSRSEIGLDINVSFKDLIGLGRTYLPPDKQEKTKRDYAIATPNVCFAKQIPWTAEVKKKLKPADGHYLWKRFTAINPRWNPYVVHAIAYAWYHIYGKKGISRLSKETRKVLKDTSHFIPLHYAPIKF